MPAGCCGCCAALRPRYKRLVDSIFPVNPQDGLVRSNMDKLLFYVMSSPEKLDRIAAYLEHRVARDIYRKRIEFVVIAVEAMDNLLVACHSQARSLNLFIESFLKTVHKLLETSTEPHLQILATQSFVKFANLEEDTPSYHQRYDFFVSKFSAMCHNNHEDPETRTQLRLSGIRGLQGVVRKTVSDNLVENIWESQHMEKIVPSLLYNMQEDRVCASSLVTGAGALLPAVRMLTGPVFLQPNPGRESGRDTPDSVGTVDEELSPSVKAESVLRELVSRAPYGNINNLLRPVFNHLDNHGMWLESAFSLRAFRVIIYSIASQHCYVVVQSLLAHLDKKQWSEAKIRAAIADVVAKIITIAAKEGPVGPAVLEIITAVLNLLRRSVNVTSNEEDEELYRSALIKAMGEYALHQPDFQKIDIMIMVMSQVPKQTLDSVDSGTHAEVLIQEILLRSLLEVARKYVTLQYKDTFQTCFLSSLSDMAVVHNPDVRLTVQQIFHTLIDRRDNLQKLITPTANYQELELFVVEMPARSDVSFFRRQGRDEIVPCLAGSLMISSNNFHHISAIYTTFCLLAVEIRCEETLVEILRVLLGVQENAVQEKINLTQLHKIQLNVMVASVFALLAFVHSYPIFSEAVDKVIQSRATKAPYLLPPLPETEPTKVDKVPGTELLFDKDALMAALENSGVDTQRMRTPYTSPSNSSAAHIDRRRSESLSTDLSTNAVEVDSAASSPQMPKRPVEEQLTFESLKKLLTEPAEKRREEIELEQMEISETFRRNRLPYLMSSQPQTDVLQNKLNEIFTKLVDSPTEGERPPSTHYEIHFPDLFVY